MREIKFRAWSIKDGTMYRVVLIDFNEQMIADEDEYFWDFDEVELMQYTGLKDMKGKEIYEGDILRFTHERKEEGFVNTNAKVEVEIPKIYYMITNPYNHNFKIIGNIYENPELLEV